MKKVLAFIAKTTFALAMFALVATSAYAWTVPSGTFPNGNVPAPVNTGNVPQTKNANLSLVGNLNAFRGFFSVLVNSPKARFGCLLFCDNIASPDVFVAGRYDAGVFGKGLGVNQDGLITTKNSPIWISLAGNTGSAGRNGLAILTSNDNLNNVTSPGAVIQTNAGKFSFFDFVGNSLVGIVAKKIQLPEGAATGKVLTSSDDIGNAVWADAAGDVSSTTTTTDGLITYVRKTGTGSTTAPCPSDFVVVGGGGFCTYGIAYSKPVISGANWNQNYSGGGPGTGWEVSCLAKATDPIGEARGVIQTSGTQSFVTADAICMKKTPVVTSISTDGSSGGGGGGGNTTTPPPVATWKTVPSNVPDGTAGQTCLQWMSTAANVPATFVQDAANIGTTGGVLGGTSSNPADRSCAHRAVAGGTTYCAVGVFTVSGVQSSPVKSCSGSSWFNGSIGAPVTITTYIKY